MEAKVNNQCGSKKGGCYFETIVIDYISPIEAKTRKRIVLKICLN